MVELIILLCALRLIVWIVSAIARSVAKDISRIKLNCLPYEEESQEVTAEDPIVIYRPDDEWRKEQERLRKERERKQKQQEIERRNRQRREIAQMDYYYLSSEFDRINGECKRLEKELLEETSPSTREKLERRIIALNEKAYKTDRKRMIAFNKLN